MVILPRPRPRWPSTAFPVLLNRRARHRTVGAERAAIAGVRLEPPAAALAVVEKLAGYALERRDRLYQAKAL
jgi:hypothetical protein